MTKINVDTALRITNFYNCCSCDNSVSVCADFSVNYSSLRESVDGIVISLLNFSALHSNLCH